MRKNLTIGFTSGWNTFLHYSRNHGRNTSHHQSTTCFSYKAPEAEASARCAVTKTSNYRSTNALFGGFHFRTVCTIVRLRKSSAHHERHDSHELRQSLCYQTADKDKICYCEQIKFNGLILNHGHSSISLTKNC